MYIDGQLFVKVKDESSEILLYKSGDEVYPQGLKEIIVKFRVTDISKPFTLDDPKLERTYLLKFDEHNRTEQLINELSSLEFIEYAEKVPLYECSLTPNDLHPNQWNLTQIQSEAAWDITTGSANVVIAIVDDAVLLSHEDLAPVIWVNTGEVPGNSLDDDGNGYIDDINGWDAADNDNDPNPVNPTNSYFTHGTHCSGIAGAATNNSVGIASVSYNVRLMAVKCASNGSGTLPAAYLGVQYAIATNADIISMSWGGGAYSQTYQNLFNAAHGDGIVLIAAAGNSNTSIGFYPASYNYIISVGATNSGDQKAGFSNYGSTIDVMAPGQDIWSSLAGSNTSYDYLSGTSMACPLVSSLAALMLSYDPSLTPDDLEACLKSSCDNIDAQNPSYIGQIGAGRINAFEALQCLKAISADFTSDWTLICPGDTVQFTDLSTNNPTSWQWSFPGGFPSSSSLQNPSVIYSSAGLYDVTLIVVNANGTDTITKTSYITVAVPTATISGTFNIPAGFNANLRVDLTGNPNWSITYFDGTSNTTINNITNTPYYITVSPTTTTTYTLISVTGNSCPGTVTGNAIITIVNSTDTICISLQPGAVVGKDAVLHGLASEVNNNYGAHVDILASAWTFSGTPGDLRSLIEFDLSFIPNGAAIVSAELSLFFNPTSSNAGHSTLSGSNECLLRKVTSTWDEMTVTWNTQPTTTINNQVTLPQTTSNTQDYPNIDVKNLVQDMVTNPSTSFGFMIRLITESYYRAMLFASSDNGDSNKWPKLDICYVASQTSSPVCLKVENFQKISDTQGNFLGTLNNDDQLGEDVDNIGDLDGDGIIDLAVGAKWDDDGGTNYGAVWIMFLNADGTVKAHQKISSTQGGFTGTLAVNDKFGTAIAPIGDLNSDGNIDILVGSHGDDDGGTDRGAVWILFLNSDGTVQANQKISSTQGGFIGVLDNNERFGERVAAIGDLNLDGVPDIAVGARRDDDGGTDKGAVWIIFLNANGTVNSHQKISDTQGNFLGTLSTSDYFGDVESIGDVNGDNIVDIAVGATLDDDGGTSSGATWILFLNTDGTVNGYQKISATQGNFTGPLNSFDRFGHAISSIGDLDSDGVPDILVNSWTDNDGGTERGAVWVLFLNSDGTVKSEFKISNTQGGFTGVLDNFDRFGTGLTPLGDFFGDGVADFACGARHDDDGGTDRGAIWILNLVDTCTTSASCPTILKEQKISDTQGDFLGILATGDVFGYSLCDIGDLDNDGVSDIAVGAMHDGDGGFQRGAVWILFLNSDGTTKSFQKISNTQGNFAGLLSDSDKFGGSICNLGDLNGDNINDIAVSAHLDDDGGGARGAVWILFLDTDGTVKSHQKISSIQGGFAGPLNNGDRWGLFMSAIGDLNGDNIMDLGVGSWGDDDGGTDRGAAWILFLNANGTVSNSQKISDTQGNFTGILDNTDRFCVVAGIGDLNDDGNDDIAVGAFGDDDGGTDRGAIWILFLGINGIVMNHQKISSTQGNFNGIPVNGDFIGRAVAGLGDFNGDGTEDILVGAYGDDDGGTDRGAAWVLFLNPDGTVLDTMKISDTRGGFTGILDNDDRFGGAVSMIRDLDGNGVPEIAIGAFNDDDGGTNKGAVWILLLDDTCSIVVIPNPPACKLYADFSADTVCLGDSTSFTDLSIDSLNNIIIWKWYYGDGDSTIGVQNPKHLYTGSGTFSVTLMIGNDAAPACFDTIVKQILVIDTLLITAPPDQSICIGDSVQLTPITINCGTAPFTYSWTPTTGLSDPSVANPNAGPQLTTTYYITVTDSTGLTATDSVTVSIQAGCCQSWPLIESDTNYCYGDSVSFVSNSIINGTAFYYWDFGPTAAPASFIGATPPPVYFDTTGVIQIMMILTDSCGVDTAFHNINMYPLPVALTISDTSVCPFDTAILGASPISDYSYDWTPGIGLSDSTIGNPVFSYDDSVTYTLVVTDRATGCVDSTTLKMTMLTFIIVDAGNDTNMCASDSIQLIASGAINYNWSPAAGLSDTAIYNPLTTIDTSITYTVIGTSGSCAIDTDSVNIVVNPLPIVSVSADVTIYYGESVQLSGSGGPSYAWTPISGLNCPTCENPIASPLETTTYYLTVTDSLGCSITDTVVVTVDLTKMIFIPNIFSPNGDGENDFFYVQGLGIAELNMLIFDRWGEKVFENTGFQADDKSTGWDGTYHGKLMNPAVFMYIVTGTFIDGSEIKEKGDLTLIK